MIEWIDTEWKEELSWCPSQLIRRFKYKGEEYMLYLRWRHENPWTLRIIKELKGERSPQYLFYEPNILEFIGIYLSMEDYKLAEEIAESMLYKLDKFGLLEDIITNKFDPVSEKSKNFKNAVAGVLLRYLIDEVY